MIGRADGSEIPAAPGIGGQLGTVVHADEGGGGAPPRAYDLVQGGHSGIGVDGVATTSAREMLIPWISFWPWTCSGSRRRERESSTPPRLSSRPRGNRWHALCSRQDWS